MAQLRATLQRLGVDLHKETFIMKSGRGRSLLIVGRTGIDSVEATLKIDFRFIHVSESSYKNLGSNVTVVMEGKAVDADGNIKVYQALGSANPDNMNMAAGYSYISDTATRRAKHKVVLKIADLYQHGVHSEDESEDFRRKPRNDVGPAMAEAISKIK